MASRARCALEGSITLKGSIMLEGNKLEELQVVILGEPSERLQRILEAALLNMPHTLVERSIDTQPGRVLIAASIGFKSFNQSLISLLGALQAGYMRLDGCAGGLVIDGNGELYTKSIAQQFILAANMAGCAFPGCPLVEGTGSLKNFTVQAGILGVSLEEAYTEAVRSLAGRLAAYKPPEILDGEAQKKLLVLHASNRETSNTWMLWGLARKHLEGRLNIKEVALRNGEIADCEGCTYTTCKHLGERGKCFYGGVLVEDVYPALLACDALLLLCPNYNDAMDANMTACINRLTALYRNHTFYEKKLFGIVVSGYSGGDIVARQMLSALCVNKSFALPQRFCMLETANDPGSILLLDGIEARAKSFAENILHELGMN